MRRQLRQGDPWALQVVSVQVLDLSNVFALADFAGEEVEVHEVVEIIDHASGYLVHDVGYSVAVHVIKNGCQQRVRCIHRDGRVGNDCSGHVHEDLSCLSTSHELGILRCCLCMRAIGWYGESDTCSLIDLCLWVGSIWSQWCGEVSDILVAKSVSEVLPMGYVAVQSGVETADSTLEYLD